MALSVLLTLCAGVLLMGIWFGLNAAMQLLLQKRYPAACRFAPAAAAAVPLILILYVSGFSVWNVPGAGDWAAWGVMAATVLLTSAVISANSAETLPQGKALLLYALDGALMELPQRGMMQPLVFALLEAQNVPDAAWIAVPITGAVWCAGILLQNAVTRTRITRRTAIELAASLLFSIGAGFVLAKTHFLPLTMLMHAAERALSTALRRRTE